MNPADLLSELAVRIYEPPLAGIRESGAIADVSNPLCVLMLLIDFDTEVTMNGIVNFIGNSTGLYVEETVAALERIGCIEQANKLADILTAASEAGMTYETIQADRISVEPGTVTSFVKLHGQKWDEAAAKIDLIYENMDMGQVFEKAEQFLAEHRAIVETALGVKPSDA